MKREKHTCFQRVVFCSLQVLNECQLRIMKLMLVLEYPVILMHISGRLCSTQVYSKPGEFLVGPHFHTNCHIQVTNLGVLRYMKCFPQLLAACVMRFPGFSFIIFIYKTNKQKKCKALYTNSAEIKDKVIGEKASETENIMGNTDRIQVNLSLSVFVSTCYLSFLFQFFHFCYLI